MYELNQVFLHELVEKDPLLGAGALEALQTFAVHLLQNRERELPVAAFRGTPEVRQRLVSQALLYEPKQGLTLAFTHQTLQESLVARSASARGTSLAAFIHDLPPFPFVRPAVRTFVLHLRVVSPQGFGKQVLAALKDDTIAYHLRRLVAETVGEIEVDEGDWPWIRRIFADEPELFRRLLFRTRGAGWFRVLRQQWLSGLLPEPRDWKFLLLRCSGTWKRQCPAECVALWRQALDQEWGETNKLIQVIRFAFDGFEDWSTDGVAALLGALVTCSTDRDDFLGKPISHYVEATNRGDDLLWCWVTRLVEPGDAGSWGRHDALRCGEYDFHREAFFAERLVASRTLFCLVLAELEGWSAARATASGQTGERLDRGFLWDTSWRKLHLFDDDHGRHSEWALLLRLFEDALAHHAAQDSELWREVEPRLRKSPSLGLRYLVIQAYRKRPERNLEGIAYQLTDRVLYKSGEDLHFELGELVRCAYPWFPENDPTLIEHQRLVLNLYAGEDWGEHEEWVARVAPDICQLLRWIPLRLPEAQQYIDTWEPIVGNIPGAPWRPGSGLGIIRAPASPEQLSGFSMEGLMRLLRHYEAVEDFDYFHVGGRSELARAL